MRTLQIRSSKHMADAPAEVLFPPGITYGHNKREEPQGANLKWSLGQHRFLSSVDPPKVWAAIIFQHGVTGARCE